MSDRPRWSDAIQIVTRIRSHDRDCEILLLLSQLPLLPAQLIGSLARPQSGASTYRCLTRLRGEGLVRTVRPAISRGHGPALHYLTDLGVATVGCLVGVEPRALARQHRLRSADLEATLAQLPQVLSCYELLAFIVASQPGSPELLKWERPFRRQFRRPTRVTPVTIKLPAYVEIRNAADVSSVLLYPDLGAIPLRAVRPSLDRLADFQSNNVGMTPTLVVATGTPERVDAWKQLLDEVVQRRGAKPMTAQLLTWAEFSGNHGVKVGACQVARARMWQLAPLDHLDPLEPRSRSQTPLPSLIGDPVIPTSATDRPSAWLGQTSIRLGPADFELVDLLSRHPFLTLRQLSSVLGVEVPTVRRRRNELITDGLLRLVRSDEIGNAMSGDEFVEATVEGLAFVAARRGLSPMTAVRALGLAGGGPEHPVGQRTALIRQFDHTCGINGFYVRLRETARYLAATGSDDALVEWRNAASCARGHLRPDAYGVYRRRGNLSGFFLEYDRGTMSAGGYAAKFAAYHAYRQSGRCAQDYDGFPTILMVTTDDVVEERIARAARVAAEGRDSLPLLLTFQQRIDDPRNRRRLLGPIWRETHARSSDRRPWILSRVCDPDLCKDSRSKSDTLK